MTLYAYPYDLTEMAMPCQHLIGLSLNQPLLKILLVKQKLLLPDQQDRSSLLRRTEELREQLREYSPPSLAARVGGAFSMQDGTQSIKLEFWGRNVLALVPSFVFVDENQAELDIFTQLLLAYYLQLSDGTPLSGNWISFSELPGGTFYAQAYQGYTGNELAKVFGDDMELFSSAARKVGGSKVEFGDDAYVFHVLPHVSLLAACWLGDEDFPTSYRILFDQSSGRHLSTDGCAILGSMLTRRLIKNKP